MDTYAIADEVRREGYAVIERLLSADEVQAIRSALSPWLRCEKMGRNDFEGFRTERVYALLAKDPEFARIVEHPDVLEVLDERLLPAYLLSASLAINVHPGETPEGFHRDNDGGPFADTSRIHGVSTIWAFDDFTADNGATEILPGSHLWTDERPVDGDPRAIPVTMPAGSVLIFTGAVYHRGGANRSDSTRLAITPQYCQSWMRQLENMVLAVPPERAAWYSPRLQALLGYSVRDPGFMGYVDGLHPKRLIDPGYVGRKARGERS